MSRRRKVSLRRSKSSTSIVSYIREVVQVIVGLLMALLVCYMMEQYGILHFGIF